jgi:glycerate 2-kinase
MTGRNLRADALEIWRAGVAAVDPARLVGRYLREHRAELDVPGRIAVVGAGKAGAAMARAVEESGLAVSRGLVNVPDATVEALPRIELHGARARPDNLPTAEGVAGAARMLEMAEALTGDDLLLGLFSGGGSALLPLPAGGVTLADKLRVTDLLMGRGASIDELNAVRKHLSGIKGGRLAAATRARVLSLIISDVRDDRLDVIASGPTAPDPSTFADALGVIWKYDLVSAAPASVLTHLTRGAAGEVPETPDELPETVGNVILGHNRLAKEEAARTARKLGYEAVLWEDFHEDAGAFVLWLTERLASLPENRPVCAISGGEATVALPPDHGLGGRNQQTALATLAALRERGLAGRCFLFAGTDGEDGPTDAAGAFVDEDLARRVVGEGLDPLSPLGRCDAYSYLDGLGALLRTGPTGTNVMDLRIALAL